jgi:hypothetical protein
MDQGELRTGEPSKLASDIDGMGGDRLAVDGNEDLLESQGSLLRDRAA